MFENVSSKISPKAMKGIKVAAVIIGATLAATAVGIVLYKSGIIGNVPEAEEIVEAALQAS